MWILTWLYKSSTAYPILLWKGDVILKKLLCLIIRTSGVKIFKSYFFRIKFCTNFFNVLSTWLSISSKCQLVIHGDGHYQKHTIYSSVAVLSLVQWNGDNVTSSRCKIVLNTRRETPCSWNSSKKQKYIFWFGFRGKLKFKYSSSHVNLLSVFVELWRVAKKSSLFIMK